MKFERLEIESTTEGKIRLLQVDDCGEEYDVFITPDMVDVVCDELQRLKKELAGK